MPLPVRRAYKGAPVTTTINSNISNSATSVTVVSVTGWPTTFPFFAVLSPGTSKEEKISVTGITSTTLTIERAKDDTSASAHDAGATIYPVFTATEADEANLIASAMAAKGDLISVSGTAGNAATYTIDRLGVGSNTHVLQADDSTSTGLKWAAVGTSNIADGAITLGKLASALQAFLVPTGSINAWSTNTAPTGWQLCDGTEVSRTTYAALFAVIGTTYGAGDGSTTFNLPNLKGRAIVGRDAAQTEFDVLGETGGAKTHTLTSAQMPAHVHAITHDHGSHSHTINHDHGSHSHSINHDHGASGSHSHTGLVDAAGTHSHSTIADTIASGTHGHQRVNFFAAGVNGATGTANPLTQDAGSHQHTFTTAAATVDIDNFTGTSGAAGVSHTGSSGTAGISHTGNSSSTGSGDAHNNLQPYMVLNYIIKH
jgi:microcystin-dependent protein